MVICCLKAIRPEMAFPSSLPPMMSARYNICAQFAQICKVYLLESLVSYYSVLQCTSRFTVVKLNCTGIRLQERCRISHIHVPEFERYSASADIFGGALAEKD